MASVLVAAISSGHSERAQVYGLNVRNPEGEMFIATSDDFAE
jgi:hypothetical protein